MSTMSVMSVVLVPSGCGKDLISHLWSVVESLLPKPALLTLHCLKSNSYWDSQEASYVQSKQWECGKRDQALDIWQNPLRGRTLYLLLSFQRRGSQKSPTNTGKRKLLSQQSPSHCPPMENSPEVQKPQKQALGPTWSFLTSSAKVWVLVVHRSWEVPGPWFLECP